MGKSSTTLICIITVFLSFFLLFNSISKLENKSVLKKIILENEEMYNSDVKEIFKSHNIPEEILDLSLKKEIFIDNYLNCIYENEKLKTSSIENEISFLIKEYKEKENVKVFKSDILKATRDITTFLNVEKARENILIVSIIGKIKYLFLLVTIILIVISLIQKRVVDISLSFLLSSFLCFLITQNNYLFKDYSEYVIKYIRDDLLNGLTLLFVIGIIILLIYLIKIIKKISLENRVNKLLD